MTSQNTGMERWTPIVLNLRCFMLLLFLRLFFSFVRIIVKVFIEFVTITNSVVYILFFLSVRYVESLLTYQGSSFHSLYWKVKSETKAYQHDLKLLGCIKLYLCPRKIPGGEILCRSHFLKFLRKFHQELEANWWWWWWRRGWLCE